MGLLVNTAVLPDGISVKNVYMSFRSENINITSGGTNQWNINTSYRVYKDENKFNNVFDIRIPIRVLTKDITRPVYDILYEQLKCIYPDSNIIL
jgi:hypothetical protein